MTTINLCIFLMATFKYLLNNYINIKLRSNIVSRDLAKVKVYLVKENDEISFKHLSREIRCYAISENYQQGDFPPQRINKMRQFRTYTICILISQNSNTFLGFELEIFYCKNIITDYFYRTGQCCSALN